jgi:hypothetical protein
MDPADVAKWSAGRKHLISPLVQDGFKRTSSSELHKPGKQLIQQLQQQLQLQIISAVSAYARPHTTFTLTEYLGNYILASADR